MESLAELRAICQTTAKKDVSNVYMRYICRALSIHVTRALIPTPVTADQVSAAMILVGILASLMFLCVNSFSFFVGALLLQLWYVLDCVDGEVARYRDYQKRRQVTSEKTELPVTGAYWDYLNHYVVHGLVPFTVGFGLFRGLGSPFWIWAGFLASLGQTLLLAVHDTKARLFLGKITKLCRSSFAVSCQASEAQVDKAEKIKQWPLRKWLFVIVHYSTTYPSVMNVLTVLGTIGLFTAPIGCRSVFVLYYAAASFWIFVGLAAANLRDSALDKEFDRTYATQKNTP